MPAYKCTLYFKLKKAVEPTQIRNGRLLEQWRWCTTDLSAKAAIVSEYDVVEAVAVSTSNCIVSVALFNVIRAVPPTMVPPACGVSVK